MYKVLICDDDKAILDTLEIYLKAADFEVYRAGDGIEALEIIDNVEIHCLILDIMMPRMSGISAMQKIRDKHNFPIILLSAKSEEIDIIGGLTDGADDYVTKPFNAAQLVARVKSQIRRYVTLGSAVIQEGVLTTGGLTLDTNKKSVTVDGKPINLTPTEYNILEFLMKNMDHVFSSRQIYGAIWNEPCDRNEKTIAVHIQKIRSKIEIDSKNPKYLKVVWGLGYKVSKE